MGLANLVAGILVVLAIVGAIALYFFERYTEAAISSKQQSLTVSREAFEPATIQELARLDTRINSSKELLAGHIAVSNLFNELEKLTLSSVRYSDFEYSVAAPGHVVLTMKGEAASFNAIALQSETFAKSAIITDPIFSNVTVGKNGNITFDFTGVIDTSRMIYTPQAVSAAPLGNTTGTPAQ